MEHGKEFLDIIENKNYDNIRFTIEAKPQDRYYYHFEVEPNLVDDKELKELTCKFFELFEKVVNAYKIQREEKVLKEISG